MGLQIRDERQMKALTGLSQAQFDSLLPVFSDIYRATQQQTYEEGLQSGTRRRRPGGGSKGKLPTMVEKLQFVLSYYKTYPTFDVLGTQFAMARSKAHENRDCSKDTGFIQPVHDGVRRGFVDGLRLGLHATYPRPSGHGSAHAPAPGRHSFASCDSVGCPAPPHSRWRGAACRQETSGPFPR